MMTKGWWTKTLTSCVKIAAGRTTGDCFSPRYLKMPGLFSIIKVSRDAISCLSSKNVSLSKMLSELNFNAFTVFHLSHRSQCKTSLSLRRRIKVLMRRSKMFFSCICSTRETWTPLQHLPFAAPRRMNPGSAASSRLPLMVER